MLLAVSNLSARIGSATLLENISFDLARGEIMGLVGESGSGKSLTALAITGLLPVIGGQISAGNLMFDGTDLAALPADQMRKLRGRRIAFITQNPMTALDPVQRIGPQVDFVSRTHLGLDRKAARQRTVELLTQLRIPQADTVCAAYPHQLSGGMKQRIVIAMALAGEPELIVADEPTTALDVTVQAQIIHLLTRLVRDRGLALVLITHDMSVVAQACDKVAVLYAGRMAEVKPVQALFAHPQHPYSAALINCIPRDGMEPGSLTGIPGNAASAFSHPSGCRYHLRCANAGPDCSTLIPEERNLSETGAVACHYPLTGKLDA